jgi:hypothetical protein
MVWKFSGLIAENYLRRPGRPVKAHRQIRDFSAPVGPGNGKNYWNKTTG